MFGARHTSAPCARHARRTSFETPPRSACLTSPQLLYYANRFKGVEHTPACPVVVCDSTLLAAQEKLGAPSALSGRSGLALGGSGSGGGGGSGSGGGSWGGAVGVVSAANVSGAGLNLTAFGLSCATNESRLEYREGVRDGVTANATCTTPVSYCTSALTLAQMRGEKELCAAAIMAMLVDGLVMYTPVAAVIGINTIMSTVLRRLGKLECHLSRTAEERSIAVKIFCAQFLNTAVIVFLVSSSLFNSQVATLEAQAGTGAGLAAPAAGAAASSQEDEEFHLAWYADVGVGVVFTLLLNALMPKVKTYGSHAVVRPAPFASRPVRRALLTSRVNPGSLFTPRQEHLRASLWPVPGGSKGV